jgi:hypothetical protein
LYQFLIPNTIRIIVDSVTSVTGRIPSPGGATRNFHLPEIAMSPLELSQRVREQEARKTELRQKDAAKCLTYRGVQYQARPRMYAYPRVSV